MSTQTLVIATNNAHKLEEIGAILAPLGIVVESGATHGFGDVEETGTTFAANALLKAQAGFRASGLPTLADDSGLAVDALDGAPGVYSARYAGASATDADNNAKLLQALAGNDQRGAAFHCAMALVVPSGAVPAAIANDWTGGELPEGGHYFIVEGQVRGRILTAHQGSGGFGYDPLFYTPVFDKTFGELASEDKNSISHRAEALKHLVTLLSALYPTPSATI